MQSACDVAFEYAHSRMAFSSPIGTFQVKNKNFLNLFYFKVKNSLKFKWLCIWLKFIFKFSPFFYSFVLNNWKEQKLCFHQKFHFPMLSFI